MFKSHEKFRLVVNLFVVITVFRDQKSNVLSCTPAATMHRDSLYLITDINSFSLLEQQVTTITTTTTTTIIMIIRDIDFV